MNDSKPPLLRALSGETLAVPPVWLMRQAGRYLPEYREVRANAGSFLDLCYSPELAAEVTLQPIRRYGLDAAILFADILLLPQALGQDLRFVEGEGPKLSPIRDQEGVDALSASGLHDTLSPVYETVSRVRAALPKEVALIGFAGAPWTVATYMVEGGGSPDHKHAKRWALADPEGFDKLIDLIAESTVSYLIRQIEAGAQVVQLFDTWAGVLDDATFARVCIRPMARITAALRAHAPDVPVIGFPRGAGARALDYVRDTGVQGIGLDYAMSRPWAAEVLQPRVTLQGNIDPQALVVGGAALDRQVDAVLDCWGAGPLVVNLGHGIVPETPPENVSRLLERVRGRAR